MRRQSLPAPKDSQNARRSVLARTITPISCANRRVLREPTLMLSIFGLVSFKPGLFLFGENLVRCVVTPKIPGNSLEIFQCRSNIIVTVPGNGGRVSVRGSRSILQGFLIAGSNFLPLGTPLLDDRSSIPRHPLFRRS